MNPFAWADDHPALSTNIVATAAFIGLRVWSYAEKSPVLLGQAEAKQRVEIYGQVTSSSVAVLAISLTVLAILVALPDRPAINDIRDSDTWPRLQGLLMSIALLALIALVCAHLGAGVDNAPKGREWLEQAMLASAGTAVVALLIAGMTFWLIIRSTGEEDDPSRGRGLG